MTARRAPSALAHVLTVAAGLLVFAAIFTYTGEGELMAAAFSGLGTTVLIQLGLLLSAWRAPRL
jgi:hypothetical protein